MGRQLAREHPVEADLVIPVPESGTPAAIGYAQESGIPYGQGLVKNSYVGPHVHPAQPDHPPARHPAQAQPAARGHPRQAAGRGRRLDRPRQHPARPGPDAARGRRRRGARADLLAAGDLAVLLRHRLRHPGRADRHRPTGRGGPGQHRRGLLGYISRGRHGRRRPSSRASALCTACFTGDLPGRRCRTSDRLGKHLLETLPGLRRRALPPTPTGSSGPTDRRSSGVPTRRRACWPVPPTR